PDDEDVAGRGPSAGVGETIDGHHVELSAGRLDGLVRDPVHQQPDGARRLRRQPDLVIRRPAIGGNRRLQAEDDQHGSQYRRLPERAAPIDEQEQREDDDRSPYNRWGFQESEQGEGDDSGQAPEDVEAVRLEGRKLSEGARHTLTHQRHHAGYAQEQKWKGDEWGKSAACPQGAEEDEFRPRAIDLDRKEPNKSDEHGQRDRGEAKQIATGVG